MLKDLIYNKKETQNNFENLTGVEKVVLMIELTDTKNSMATEQQEKEFITELAKDPTQLKHYKIYLKNQIEDMRQKYESFKKLFETIK